MLSPVTHIAQVSMRRGEVQLNQPKTVHSHLISIFLNERLCFVPQISYTIYTVELDIWNWLDPYYSAIQMKST